MCRNRHNQRPLGYAYVNYYRREDAERALHTPNFTLVHNRACRFMWALRDSALRKSGLSNVFVNDLAKSATYRQLHDAFARYGAILSCQWAVNNHKQRSLGYGFVHIESEGAAERAIAAADGTLVASEKVRVEQFRPKEQRPHRSARATAQLDTLHKQSADEKSSRRAVYSLLNRAQLSSAARSAGAARSSSRWPPRPASAAAAPSSQTAPRCASAPRTEPRE